MRADPSAAIANLEAYGHENRLPPLLWLAPGNADSDIQGFGTVESCRSWAVLLDLDADSYHPSRSWSGTLSGLRLALQAD